MAYNPNNPNGQASMAGSQPVVIASNQSPVSVLATITGNPSVSGTVGSSVVGQAILTDQDNVTNGFAGGLAQAHLNVYNGVNWDRLRGNSSIGALVNVTGSVITVPQSSTAVAIVSGSIAVSVTPPANQSVSGTVQADIRGSVATVIIGGSIAASFTPPANQSVSGTVNVGNFPTTQNVSGSVVTFPQGTIVTSLVSTVPSSVIVGASIFGLPPVNVTNTNLNVGGSVVAFQGSGWSGSIAATITNSNVNVAGSVVAFQGGTQISSVSGGQVSVFQAGTWSTSVMTNVITSIATAGQVMGSVAALQATNPWVVTGNVTGSVLSLQSGAYTNSIIGGASVFQFGTWQVSVVSANPSSTLVGNYAQRNDTVSSFLGGNLTWNPQATDSAGRLLIKPFASEDGTIISYTGSVVSGSVTLIQASAIGKKNYITDFWLSNTGATTTLVTFQGGDTSLVGQFIAPTGGGMASPGIAVPLKTTLSQDLAFKAGTSTSILYLTLKGYQAP